MNPEGYESLDGRLRALKIVFALMAVPTGRVATSLRDRARRRIA